MAQTQPLSWDDSASESSARTSSTELESTCPSVSELPKTRRPINEKTRALFVKTEFCRYYRNGNCTLGDKCSFAHEEGDLRVRPNLTHTSLCHFWAKDRCKKGASCPFAHGKEKLRSRHDIAHHVAAHANKPVHQGKISKPGARSSPASVSNAASIPAASAKAVPERGSHCPSCICPINSIEARFCAMCGGALVRHAMLDHGPAQPSSYNLQGHCHRVFSADRDAPEPDSCSSHIACGVTQVSTAASVAQMDSWRAANILLQACSPHGSLLVPLLVNTDGASAALSETQGAALQAQNTGAGFGGVHGPQGTSMPGQDPDSLSQLLSAISRQQVYED